MTTHNGKRISLVLGSGGARGLAHIGVIQWLEEQGWEICSIAGSSMGALVGGVYCAGKLEDYSRWVKALDQGDVLKLLDFSFSGGGLFKGDKLINLLRELVGERDIEELPVRFTAVATDVEEQDEIWLNSGSLFDAIRASIAVPTLFTPYTINGRKLLDGGLLNPLPIAPTVSDHVDLTIAVNVCADPAAHFAASELPHGSEPDAGYRAKIQQFLLDLLRGEEDQPKNWGLYDVVMLSFDTMQNAIARMKLAAYPPDITLEIPRNVARAFEFYQAERLIQYGYDTAEETIGRYLGEHGSRD